MSSDLWRMLKARQDVFGALLGQMLDRHCRDVPAALGNAMRYSLLSSGKRLRPILVMLASEAGGGTDEQAMPAACAVEMVHAYSLIHDDLPAMDDDDLRRGQPTCHKKYGEALAILAGDGLLTLAFEVLAEGYPPATAAVSCAELARGAGIGGMVGGQVLDLTADGKIDGGTRLESVADLEAIHRRKTGALFHASLRLGLLAAQGSRIGGVDKALQAKLDTYGRAFGLAFQIADDLLDVEGSANVAGKRVGKDSARGKLTYPRLLGIAESRDRANRLVAEAVAAVAELGSAGESLASIVRYVMERDR